MSKSYEVQVAGDLNELVEKAKKAATENKVDFNGDTSSGSFNGRGFKGKYSISGNTITVTITDKPFIIPWGIIEKKIKEYGNV